MQKKCDLYLCEPTRNDRLKFLRLFDESFQYDESKTYVNYLGINVDRIKLISVVSDLRKHGIMCFSVPIEYRRDGKLSMEAATVRANEYARSIGASAVPSIMLKSNSPPVYWIFDLQNNYNHISLISKLLIKCYIDSLKFMEQGL